MSAKGKEFKVNVTASRATAISSSAGSYPNVLYFPIDDDNVQSQKSATCIIDSGNVIVKYLHPGNNDWIVIAKCVPASSGDNWDNAQFSVRIVKPSDSAGITIE